MTNLLILMALLVNTANTWLQRLRSTSSQRAANALSPQIDSICLPISLLLYSSYTDKNMKCLQRIVNLIYLNQIYGRQCANKVLSKNDQYFGFEII